MGSQYFYQLTFIFFGASILGTLFIYLKQPVILAYILIGLLAGPFGFAVVTNVEEVQNIGKLGIVFLLFLLGLNLPLRKMIGLFKQSALLSISACFILAITTAVTCVWFGFSWHDSIFIGLALMFSSTVIGLKLIPTTALHHQRIGAVMTSVLLLEDLIAIGLILASMSRGGDERGFFAYILPVLTLIGLLVGSYYCVKYVLLKLFMKYDTIQEYMFLLSLGWCFVMAELADFGGLSHEIGAFIAGTSLTTSPISLLIAEHLKPLREFFLILFFFAVGALFDYQQLTLSMLILSFVLILILNGAKPFIFRFGFRLLGEAPAASKELGVRLGQVSEFALLLSATYLSTGLITKQAGTLINFIVILSFIISTYWIVKHYPTPISNNEKQRTD